MPEEVPSVTLSNGLSMPIIGLGTWKSQPGEVTQAVMEAISVGYRHIDCAYVYLNEEEVGKGLKAKMDDGTVKREDLFITSKLWITNMPKETVRPALEKSLKLLRLSYLDLYLMHWPVAFKTGDDPWPQDAQGDPEFFNESDYVDTWRGMEECVRAGLVKSIGVSNFNKRQIETLLRAAQIPPINNQVECHPYLPQKKLIEFCESKGITVSAYSPLGSPDRPVVDPDHPVLMEEPIIKALSEKYNKSPAQILIRYQIENGTPVLPKSVTPSRIKSNFEVFDFKLSPADMKLLESFSKEIRYLTFSMVSPHPEYPFTEKDPY